MCTIISTKNTIAWFWLLFITVIVTSCNKDKVNPAVAIQIDEIPNTNSGDTVLYEGNFMNAAHPTSGKAQVIKNNNNELELIFTDFKTDSGPDLRVYLAKDNKASDFVEISKEVKNGNVKYKLPSSIDLSKKNNVLIWCKLFSVNFGTAVLEKKEN